MNNYCSICGVECSGKILIEARKNKYYEVCGSCFRRYEFTDLKEIRKLIRRNK